ncbi:MAG: hypothetical protein RIS13_947, partial [Bacteroidota bacterium]
MNVMNMFNEIDAQLMMGRFSMMPDLTAYMTNPARDLAPVFTFSLSRM